MRQLTFISYLKQYIRELSGESTLSVHKLVKKTKKNYRLVDSLILYCALSNKRELFIKYSKGEYSGVIASLNKDNFLSETYRDYDFVKLWDGYQHKINLINYDNDIKEKIRDNIIVIMKENNISKYRVYKDLNLNHGNVNDYLKNGNCEKVSLSIAKKIFNYVNS